MTARLFSVLALVALLASAGVAQISPRQVTQTPRDLYHQGARLFVDGDDAAALAAVEAGLAQAPGDARLQALRDLIQQNQDENDQQDQSDDQQEGGEDQESQDGDEGEPGENGDPGDQPPAEEPEAERDQTQTAPKPSGNRQAQPQAGEPGEMTQAQADRLLDAVGGEERLLLREMRRPPTQRRRSDKDW